MKTEPMESVLRDMHDLFDYAAGELYWKVDAGYGRMKGDAVTKVNNMGRKIVSFRCRAFLAHRVIFFYHHGYTPDFIDHIDGNPLNCCVENLRPCTKSENAFNAKTHRDSKSGVRGVSWVSKSQSWRVQLKIKGMRHYLGLFDTLDEAKAVADGFRALQHKEFFSDR